MILKPTHVKSNTCLIVFNLAIALSLSACATKPKVPQIKYDDFDFDPAIYQAEPTLPVKVVKLPDPLPLSGQLKKLPRKGEKQTKGLRAPGYHVLDANKAAKMEPSQDGYINAIQNYPFVKGALYQLYAAVNQVFDIALEPGEKLMSVSSGDTVRWVIGDTVSGGGTLEQVHILIKPITPDLQTNLIIATNRRTYHLEMHSTDDTYMASISWIYPYLDLVALQKQNAEALQTASRTVDKNLKLDQLKFRYKITGDAPWKPIRAFDDGKTNCRIIIIIHLINICPPNGN